MASGSIHIPRPLSSEQVQGLFSSQRSGDPLGVRIHLVLAMAACFLAGWPTTVVDWAAAGVLLCFLIRMTGWHSILEPLAFDRVLQLLLALWAWIGLSVLWSAGHGWADWTVDVRNLRFLALPLLIWPVMDRRHWLIVAVMAGIACGELSQMVHLAAIKFGWDWIPMHRMPGRVSGWWDPVSGGTVLCAGLGLWLGPALFARVRAWRVCGAIGVCTTLAGIALTGTRGAWIGAAILCGLALAIAAWQIRPRSRVLRPAIVVLLLAVIGGGIAYGVAGQRITERLHRGIDEVHAAIESRNYSTDTGLRLAMWRWALAAAREHPVLGVGAGGFQPWVRSQTAETAARLNAPIDAAASVHAHAHSWYLHTLATGGLVGLALLVSMLVLAARSGLRECADNADPQHLWGVWVSPALALLGLACAGLFDTVTVNQQPAYMLYVCVGLCLPSRPREFGGKA